MSAFFAIARIRAAIPFLDMFTFLTALLPTLGAALGAIGAQGDFRTRSEQSERTAAQLEAINQALTDEPLDFARLADRVQKTSGHHDGRS